MALPVTIPNAFANATASIPLSQLDTNFNTLANAVNGISDGSETLANASVTVLTAGTVDINGGAIDGTTVGTSNAAAGSFTTLNTSGAVVFNDAGADVDFRVESDTDENALFVEGSSGNVGIGTSSPGQKLHVAGNIRTANSLIEDTSTNVNFGTTAAGYLAFLAGSGAERMRIDSSGNLLVGKTAVGSVSDTVTGVSVYGAGVLRAVIAGQPSGYFQRNTSDGEIVRFSKDGTTVGTIGTIDDNSVFIGNFQTNAVGLRFIGITNDIRPCNSTGAARDNAIDFGDANARFVNIFATNATIQTSDRNEKQDIEALSEAEARVAVAAKGLMKKYRWKHRVATEGDNARIHFGIIAQDLKAAFEAEGLDAHRYSMFTKDEWWETQTEVPAVEAQEAVYETQTDEEGNEVQVLVSEAVEAKEAYTRTDTYETEEEAPEGAVRKERMGIRYNELLAFIIAAL